MNQLISISINESGIKTVNARDLHAFLESKQDFSTWIKARVDQYGFVENEDFTVHKFVDRRGNVVDYHITLDMAKELSMVERTAKGKMARRYFIKCEKVANGEVKQSKRIRKDDGAMEAFRLARAAEINMKTAERIFAHLPNLGVNAKQCILASMINPVMGSEVIALPKVTEHLRLASEFSDELGVSSNMVGRIANEHGLKTPEYGEYRLNKAIGNERQIESFYYNERGVQAIGEIIAKRGKVA